MLATRAPPEVEQRRVEELFLGLRVQVEERGKTLPDRGEAVRVVPIDLFEDGEEPSLLVMVVQDQLRDVHGRAS